MNITPFDFNSHEIRTVTPEDGSIWFVAKDVCDVLEISNHRDAISRLDDDEKGICSVYDVRGVLQETTIINESGLYALILSSRKPQAKPFKKWVTSEILPSIRRSGVFTIPEAFGMIEVCEEEARELFVYRIRNTLTGNVKIGISCNPQARLKQLQTGNDGRLILESYYLAIDGFADERREHLANASNHVLGEWFKV